MKTWIEPPEVIVPEALRAAVGGHPLVAATLARRGLTDVESVLAFLDPAHYTPTPPADLPNLLLAADRVEQAIHTHELICVWGDFDVDGQTATALLVSTLRDLGAEVTYHVPVRETESHGVNRPVLEQIISDGARLILTCDTGITAHEAAGYARLQGVDFVVTDHHELPPARSLPDAFAIVNPKMLPEGHPLHDLPGAGVAYKLAEALYSRAPASGPDAANRHLDLVALGIVADLAVLAGDTRSLLQRGLAALRRTGRLGLRVLMETAELDPTWLTEEHISYVLAPRLNAAGRLADANAAVELLTTADLMVARILANQMEALNAQRKLMCDHVYAGAEAQIARDPELLRSGALVLSNPAWPAGVIGIVANRLVERYGRPTVLIATPPGQVGRGSARSVEGFNITAAIGAHAGLLLGFGGHPMAAGLTIDPERIPEFRRALSRTAETMLGKSRIGPRLPVDGYLSLAELSLPLVEDLARLSPFGPGNPPLTLVSTGLTIQNERTVGRNNEHRLITVADAEGTTTRIIWWDGAAEDLPTGAFDLAYIARASDYRGEREAQVEWIDARPAAGTPFVEVVPKQAQIEVIDRRGVANPWTELTRLRSEGGIAVWREAEAARAIEGHDRYGLRRSQALAIWTAPPGPAELRAALTQVSPARVYLFGLDPGLDQSEAFLRRLVGLVKHALQAHEGRTAISSLAAATAQREATVGLGLDWLASRGHIAVLERESDEVRLAGSNLPAEATELARITARLEALLAETAAYRAYFRHADKVAVTHL